MPTQNHQHEDNWSAAGMVSMFDAVHRERDRRRYRLGVCLWTLTIAVCLGVPLWITWEKFQDARRQTLLEEFETHRPAAEQLNQSNPAVVKALSQADTLRSAVHTQTVAESIAALRQALSLLAEAHDLDRDTKRLRQLLDPVGKTLVETPWHVTSTKISQQQKALGEAHKSIVALLEQGQAAQAEKALADLLTQVGLLQRDNVEAMETETARQAWVHMKSKIPQRLTEAPALAAIYRRGADGDRGWDEGDWNNSRLCYSGAADDLQKLLESELSPDEKAKLLQSDTDALARLETEKADLQGKISSLEQQLADLGRQLATTNGERQEALARVKSLTGNIASLTTERDRLKTDGAAADAELMTLRPLKKQIEDLTSAKTAAEGQIASLTTAKKSAEDALAKSEVQLNAQDQQIKALQTVIASNGGNGPEVQVSATLVAIDAQLTANVAGKDTPAAVKLARERLAEALEQYDQAVKLKQQALAEKYLPTSDKVTGIEATIAQAETTLRNALKVLDEPLAAQFEQLRGTIATAQSAYQSLLKQVAPDHKDALKLKARIDGLKGDQTALAPAHARHNGQQTPPASELVVLCRTQVQELLSERQRAEFERLRREGKISAGHRLVVRMEAVELPLRWCPPGTFLMGSPPDEPNRGNDEDQVSVTLTRGYWMGETETTQALYESVMGTNPSHFKGPRRPVESLSLGDMEAFCQKLTARERAAGRLSATAEYRLPTEAEWEYACRAGTTTATAFGNTLSSQQVNFDGNYPYNGAAKGPYLERTADVGSYAANAWGLYDMHGNVWERCADRYQSKLPGGTDPFDSSSDEQSRVLRGGGWYSIGHRVRSSNRNDYSPENRNDVIGFRCLRTE